MSAEEGERIARRWLEDREISLAVRRLQQHLDLVSDALHVYGPGQMVLDAERWAALRCRDWPYLKSMRHEAVHMKNIGLRRIRFAAREELVAINGRVLITERDILIEHEPDGQWRSVEETIRAHTVSEPERREPVEAQVL